MTTGHYLVINERSYCGYCGGGAAPKETSHQTLFVLGERGGRGCGVVWTHVTTDYILKEFEEHARLCRPDLPFVSVNERYSDDEEAR